MYYLMVLRSKINFMMSCVWLCGWSQIQDLRSRKISSTMPRRPRPGHRARPRSKGTLPHRNHVKPPTKSQQHVIRPLIANAHEGNSSEDDENYPNEGDGYFDDRSDDSDNEDKDLDGDEEADTPRVAQWMDEDEPEEQDDGSSGEEGEEAGSPQLVLHHDCSLAHN